MVKIKSGCRVNPSMQRYIMSKPIAFTQTSLKDWKLVYLVLYKNIGDNPELMDVEFFSQLQTILQKHAENQRINPLDHDEWIEWLNNNDD